MEPTWPNGMKLERHLRRPHLLIVNGKLLGEVTGYETTLVVEDGSDPWTRYTVAPYNPPPPVTVEAPVPGRWYDAAAHLPREIQVVMVQTLDGVARTSFYHPDRGGWWRNRDNYDLPVTHWRIPS